MFEEFSAGYYIGRLYVQPTDRDAPLMARAQHELVNRQLYSDGEGLERLDTPLVMKIDERHVPVHGDEGVPRDTVVLPEGVLEDTRIDAPPELTEVLLAKADRARQLLRITGGSDLRPAN